MKNNNRIKLDYGNVVHIEMDKRGFIISSEGLENLIPINKIDETVVGSHLTELQTRIKKYNGNQELADGFVKTIDEKRKLKTKRRKHV